MTAQSNDELQRKILELDTKLTKLVKARKRDERRPTPVDQGRWYPSMQIPASTDSKRGMQVRTQRACVQSSSLNSAFPDS